MRIVVNGLSSGGVKEAAVAVAAAPGVGFDLIVTDGRGCACSDRGLLLSPVPTWVTNADFRRSMETVSLRPLTSRVKCFSFLSSTRKGPS